MAESIELKRKRAKAKLKLQQMEGYGQIGTGSATEKTQRLNELRGDLIRMRTNREQILKDAQKESFAEEPFYNKLASGVGRAMHSGAVAPAKKLVGKALGRPEMGQEVEEEAQLYKDISKGSGWARAGEIGADVAALAVPAAKLSKLGSLGKLKNLAKPLQAMIGGAAAAVPSAGLHQVQSHAETGQGSPIEAAVEIFGSAALPMVGSAVSSPLRELAKGGATKIIQTATKLSKQIKGQKTMNPRQVQNYFDNYASWRNILGSEKKLAKHEDVLGNSFDELMNKISKGKQVDVNKAIGRTRNRVERLIKTGSINLDDAPKVLKKIDEFEGMVKPLTNKDGLVNFKAAQRFKHGTLDEMAQYDKPSGVFNPELKAPSQAARATRGNVLSEMSRVEPQLAPLNREYRKMADVRPFISQAAERFRANRGASLQDLGTLGLALHAGKAVAGLPFALSRAQKSPMVAKGLWELGRGLPPGLQSLGMQTGRSSMANLYGGE